MTSGPGATNALTGTVNADSCGTPLMTISGEVAEMWFGMAYLQEGIDSGLDVDDVYRAACHYSAVIDNPMNFCTLFEQALRDARAVPGRAVHVTLPVDVSKQSLASVTVPAAPVNYRPSPPGGCDPSTAGQIVDALLGAQHPVIMLGNGARTAMRGARQAALAAFVEQYSIPVMTTPGAKGIFPEGHVLSLRNYGLAGSRWATSYLVGYPSPAPFDALLVIGSDLGELATTVTVGATTLYDKELLPAGPFIHVDADPGVIGRAFPRRCRGRGRGRRDDRRGAGGGPGQAGARLRRLRAPGADCRDQAQRGAGPAAGRGSDPRDRRPDRADACPQPRAAGRVAVLL